MCTKKRRKNRPGVTKRCAAQPHSRLPLTSLRVHAKPLGVLNVAGFYDRMIDFVRHAAEERFIRADHWDLMIVEATIPLLVERLRLHAPRVSRGAGSDLSRS